MSANSNFGPPPPMFGGSMGVPIIPSTINMEYFQAMISNRSSNFVFRPMVNFIASCYEELVRSGKEDMPEKCRFFIYHSGVQVMWPVISLEMHLLDSLSDEDRPVTDKERLRELYKKLKPMLNQCGEIRFKVVRTAGELSQYMVTVFFGGKSQEFPADPTNLQIIIRLAEEEAYRKLNCESAKKFAMCVLMMMSLERFDFDYEIEIAEEVYDGSRVKEVLDKHGHRDK